MAVRIESPGGHPLLFYTPWFWLLRDGESGTDSKSLRECVDAGGAPPVECEAKTGASVVLAPAPVR